MAHEKDLANQLVRTAFPGGGAPPVHEPPHAGLLKSILGGHHPAEPPVMQKVHFTDCGYTDEGPEPFVCGWCRFMILGGDLGQCSRTHGPHPDGDVAATGACIFFKHREEAEHAAMPIAHELTGEHKGGTQEPRYGRGTGEVSNPQMGEGEGGWDMPPGDGQDESGYDRQNNSNDRLKGIEVEEG